MEESKDDRPGDYDRQSKGQNQGQSRGQMLEQYSKILTEFFERMSSWEHSVVQHSEVSLPQMHLLEVVGNRGKLRMKELSEILGVTTGTVTVMVYRLEEKGYVARERDAGDRRSFFVTLTDKGSGEYVKHHKMHHHLIEEIVELLGDKGAEDFFTKIKEVYRLL
ncbi:MAG: MarR family winged helix-turn-helix transcriptional regulator [Spirochaetaceae bacterium]